MSKQKVWIDLQDMDHATARKVSLASEQLGVMCRIHPKSNRAQLIRQVDEKFAIACFANEGPSEEEKNDKWTVDSEDVARVKAALETNREIV